jgi:eukaryotic translation initiation factor 2-alpha kinase 4
LRIQECWHKHIRHHRDTVNGTNEPDVRILASQHKGKEQNRYAIADAAAIRARELANSFIADAPVAAIETSDEILEAMLDMCLNDPQSWCTLI